MQHNDTQAKIHSALQLAVDDSTTTTTQQELLNFLSSKHDIKDDEYQYQLHHDQDKIIEHFGGLHNILRLYLSNTMDDEVTNNLYTYFTKNISENVSANLSVPTISTMMGENTQIAHEINRQNELIRKHITLVNSGTGDEFDDKNITIPSLRTQRSAFFPEILKIDIDDNTYFRLFKSKQKASNFYHNVVLGKYMKIAICILICGWVILPAFCTLYALGSTFCTNLEPWYFYVCVPLAAIYFLLHIMALNYELMRQIVKTFDFGYKTYNMLVIFITAPGLMAAQYERISYIILFEILLMFAFIAGVGIDALFMKEMVKVFLTSAFIASIVVGICNTYFMADDVHWDPFNGSFGETATAISFKSAAINASANLVLILVKSLTTIIKSRIQQKRNRMGMTATVTQQGYRQSSILLNRPFVQWIDCVNCNANNVTS